MQYTTSKTHHIKKHTTSKTLICFDINKLFPLFTALLQIIRLSKKISFVKYLLLIIYSLFIFSHELYAQGIKSNLDHIPLKTQFKPVDYKGGIQSWSFDQDSLGILYAANNHGLLEFDGVNWKLYKVPNSGRTRSVKVDKQNRIFVGGQGQLGYFYKTKNNLSFVSLLDLLPADKKEIAETWKILENDGIIYFNTESELFAYQNDSIKALNLAGYMRYAFVVNGEVFAQFYNNGLFKLDNNEFISIGGTKITSDIVSIIESNGHIYCFTREGQVYELTNSGLLRKEIPVALGTVNDVKKIKSGEYAIGTQNNGLFFFNPDLTLNRLLTKNRGLSDRTVKAIYEDQFENLWLALNNGIDYLELSLPFSLLNEETGIEGTGYTAIKHNNQVYLGTNNGVFTQNLEPLGLEEFPFEFLQESEGQVYNFSGVGNSLIINHDFGAFELTKKKLNRFEEIGSWKSMDMESKGRILNSGYRGISIFERKKDQWTKVKSIPNLDESLRMVEFQNDSTLWATHASKGAFKIQLDKNGDVKNDIKLYDGKDGFPSNLKIDVYSLNDKLIFTSENGIYDFDTEKQLFTPNTYLNNWLGKQYINEIVSTKDNSIYFIQNLSIGELKQKGYGNYEKSTHIFKHVNKFINDDLPNISILDNDHIIIGAKEGFILYQPNKNKLIPNTFKTILRYAEIETSSDSIDIYDLSIYNNIKVDKNKSIKFQYASTYFDGFKDLTFSYRLMPLDENWSKWSPMAEKEYNYLPHGNYTFEVKALNIYEDESDIATFSFEILTPWYFSAWAKLVYFILVLIAFLLFPLVQRKKFKAENLIIKESKEKELKIKDREINKLVNEKLQSELDLKNDQLTTTAMQLIKDNEFIKEIQIKIQKAIDHKNPSKKLNNIINMIDKALSHNDSWDKFEYHFDQVHGNYLKKLLDNDIKLSPREIKLAAFLRMNMSSKEIATMLNITTRGVELARYRLRKKLKLEREQNLVEYLIELDNS